MWKYANLLVDDLLGDLAAARSLDPRYLMLQSTAAKHHEHERRVDLKQRFPASPRRKRSTSFWNIPGSVLGLIPADRFDSLQPTGKPHGPTSRLSLLIRVSPYQVQTTSPTDFTPHPS
jgi:hypothetical protein